MRFGSRAAVDELILLMDWVDEAYYDRGFVATPGGQWQLRALAPALILNDAGLAS